MLFPELGCYVLPGHIFDPLEMVDEVRSAEKLGLGSVWLSERFSSKNADVLCGAMAMLTGSMGIVAGLIQNLPLRHPIVTAGFGATMAKLTSGRFSLGIGRGTNSFADSTGTAHVTFKIMEDYITLLRKLWKGEDISYTGPLGTFANLRLGVTLERPPPIIVATMGERTLKWAGRLADGVLLNSLWTAEAVKKSVTLVRQGAEEAGRDPDSVRIWTILVTACDVPEEKFLTSVVRRMNTYLLFPPLFDGICEGNGWDKREAARLRAAYLDIDKGGSKGTMGDEAATRDLQQLREMAALYPRAWIEAGNAVGTSSDGARAIQDRFLAGANGILFHGSHPQDLAGTLSAWGAIRPKARDCSAVNPVA